MRKDAALVISVLLFFGLVQVGHGRLYRWVDKDGNVQYSDRIPPDQVEVGRTEISKGGIQINSVPRAQTPEEIQKEKELERLRAEQEKLVKEQEKADRGLLRTFASTDDIIMARDGKITAVDVGIDVIKTNVLRQQERLEKLLAEAADLERAGKPVSEQRSAVIAQAEQSIRSSYATIVEKEKQKDAIRTQFDQDLERFRQLKNLPKSEPSILPPTKRPILHNIVGCADADECDRLWKKATDYVRQHATTAVQTSSAVIFITAPPVVAEDISLILSRIDNKEGPGASLFLDLQCQRSAPGKEFCQDKKAQGVIQGFRPAITGEQAPPS